MTLQPKSKRSFLQRLERLLMLHLPLARRSREASSCQYDVQAVQTVLALSLLLLQVRDISINEAWQDAMHLSVPVLAVWDSQGQEVRHCAAQHAIAVPRTWRIFLFQR